MMKSQGQSLQLFKNCGAQVEYHPVAHAYLDKIVSDRDDTFCQEEQDGRPGQPCQQAGTCMSARQSPDPGDNFGYGSILEHVINYQL